MLPPASGDAAACDAAYAKFTRLAPPDQHLAEAGMALAAMVALCGCASGEAMRTAQNSMIINTDAAPACGPLGAARVGRPSITCMA